MTPWNSPVTVCFRMTHVAFTVDFAGILITWSTFQDWVTVLVCETEDSTLMSKLRVEETSIIAGMLAFTVTEYPTSIVVFRDQVKLL